MLLWNAMAAVIGSPIPALEEPRCESTRLLFVDTFKGTCVYNQMDDVGTIRNQNFSGLRNKQECSGIHQCIRVSMQWAGEAEDPRKNPPTNVIPTCENPVTRPGIEPGSPGGRRTWLDYSPPTKANRVQFPEGSLPDFRYFGIVADYVASGRVFSGIFRFLHPFIPALLDTHLATPVSVLKASMPYCSINQHQRFITPDGDEVAYNRRVATPVILATGSVITSEAAREELPELRSLAASRATRILRATDRSSELVQRASRRILFAVAWLRSPWRWCMSWSCDEYDSPLRWWSLWWCESDDVESDDVVSDESLECVEPVVDDDVEPVVSWWWPPRASEHHADMHRRNTTSLNIAPTTSDHVPSGRRRQTQYVLRGSEAVTLTPRAGVIASCYRVCSSLRLDHMCVECHRDGSPIPDVSNRSFNRFDVASSWKPRVSRVHQSDVGWCSRIRYSNHQEPTRIHQRIQEFHATLDVAQLLVDGRSRMQDVRLRCKAQISPSSPVLREVGAESAEFLWNNSNIKSLNTYIREHIVTCSLLRVPCERLEVKDSSYMIAASERRKIVLIQHVGDRWVAAYLLQKLIFLHLSRKNIITVTFPRTTLIAKNVLYGAYEGEGRLQRSARGRRRARVQRRAGLIRGTDLRDCGLDARVKRHS
ncbi:hypothetical protein PR048_032800 [Dryococelus australis]|uniref:Uncharacterized protein n=1 Tax=Dryococelus australis TaxID=614101 RepID=A0ABQ9G6E3_9NEOP|nr:hypothetical protein PR048_032800 [Dryococelus australis]